MQTIRTVTRQELSSLVTRPNVVLFEALSEAHWASGHLPGAHAMPLERIAQVAAEVAPDKQAEVVVYCASEACANSTIAASKLASLGYASVRVFPGGKAEWKASGLPLEVSR
jgi:rhodanese-related sulfurtransferase